MENIELLKEQIAEKYNLDIRFADGFDEAIIGVVQVAGNYVVAYSRSKCIDILAKEMEYGDAEEYFEFNVEDAYIGKNTPVFLTDVKEILY